MTAAADSPGKDPSTRKGFLHPLRVLVADDDRVVRTVLCRLLEERGYKVDVAEDAPEALARAEAKDFDAVVLDVDMPGGGLSAARQLLGRPGFDAFVVLMSGHVEVDGGDPALDRLPRLVKPFRSEELIRVLEEGVRGR